MMEEKIIPIIKNFNSNYNKFKKYIENEFYIINSNDGGKNNTHY